MLGSSATCFFLSVTAHQRLRPPGAGTDDAALIDVLCTLNGPQIIAMKQAYAAMYKKDATKIIHGEASGNYRLLLEVCDGDVM
jgi:hypothetical protein